MTRSQSIVFLKHGKEKPVRNRHPWVFSGAISRIQGQPSDGDIVDVVDPEGRFLARGYINRHSQITVRLLTWTEDEPVNMDLWKRRMQQAIERRRRLFEDQLTTAYRLIYAESDLLPGLIVDCYDDYLVIQALTLGIERRKSELVSILADLLQPTGIYERSDVSIRKKERLPLCSGPLWGQEPPQLLEIRENGHSFEVDIRGGQKTGFYLDQRDNRSRLTDYCAGCSVLDAFAYTGGFGIYAAAAGADRITYLDSSAPALALARSNMRLNHHTRRDDEYVVGDVFAVLRRYREEDRRFDIIVLDPPKFAHSRSQVPSACRGYKDINLLAMQLLRPGGILFTLSCSGVIKPDLFQKVVFGASVDAQRDAQVLERLSQSADHPILLTFPEGEYLKGLVCRTL